MKCRGAGHRNQQQCEMTTHSLTHCEYSLFLCAMHVMKLGLGEQRAINQKKKKSNVAKAFNA